MTPSLFIATPAYGGLVYDSYNRSMDATLALCTQKGVQVHRWTSRNESLITRARNSAVSDFLKSPCTHLLFIDADISWPAEAPLNMLATGHDVVAISYPKKSINWAAVRDAVWRGEEDLAAFQADHVINVASKEVQVVNGCVEVLDAGTGFMLIAREAIMKLLYAHPEWMYLSDSPNSRYQPMFTVFDCSIDDRHITDGVGRYLSEDYRFCREWQRIGGKVMLLLDDRLEHTGTYTFRGKLPFRSQPTEYSLPEQNSPQYAKVMTDRYEWAAKRLAGSKVILNACSGPGYGHPILAAGGAEVVNVDRSEECERIAIERSWTPFERTDDIEAPGFIDLVINLTVDRGDPALCCIETIEHLKDPVRFIRAIRHYVQSAVFSVPCVPTKHANPYHLHDFTTDGFLMILRAAGWEILEHTHLTTDVVIVHARPSGD